MDIPVLLYFKISNEYCLMLLHENLTIIDQCSMSSLLKFAGQNWCDWEESLPIDHLLEPNSYLPNKIHQKCQSKVTPYPKNTNSRNSYAKSQFSTENHIKSRLVIDDTMKLPIKDMSIFGLCPADDDLVLVTCDICQYSVKIEAFESHMESRHKKEHKAVKTAIKSLDEQQRVTIAQSKKARERAPPRVDPIIPKITKSNEPHKIKGAHNLHFTKHHPKPLAVCIFGSKRIGGLLTVDRSQFLARKLIKSTISTENSLNQYNDSNEHERCHLN